MALIPVERVLKRVPAYFPFTGVSIFFSLIDFRSGFVRLCCTTGVFLGGHCAVSLSILRRIASLELNVFDRVIAEI